jgi:hypothetical protein
MRCPNCGHDVPAGAFCVRCGEPLENRASPYPLEGRGYAAAPHERWTVPRVVSSLYPHLPRADMASFRMALVLGAAAIVALALFRLFPLALVVSAALVPMLTILYLWDVDLYEDEPAPMLTFTILWGAAAGAALGLAARAATSATATLTGAVTSHELVWLGILVPLLSVAAMLAGPSILLSYRRFDDVLDGVTFGGACAVTLVGAEVLANSGEFLSQGIKADGEISLWVARLLLLGVALPVLAAAVVGSAGGALWARYRAPLGDRKALGLLGSPLVTAPLAAGSIVAVNICQLHFGPWTSLGFTAFLALAGLVALRRVIHLGLLEEASEIGIGAPVRCANCERETPLHTFCVHCGIALRALPKRRRSERPAERLAARLGRPLVLAAFGLAVATAAVVGLGVIALAQPAPARPPCLPERPCGAPPAQRPMPRAEPRSRAGGAYVTGRAWRSGAGVGLRYRPDEWDVERATASELALRATLRSGIVIVHVRVFSGILPPLVALHQAVRSEAAHDYLGLSADDVPAHVLLDPVLGGIRAVGGAYKTTSALPPSPSGRVELMFQVASRGLTTVVVEAVTSEKPRGQGRGVDSPFPAYGAADALLETFDWGRQL